LEAAPGIKYKAALVVAYGAGLRVSEVVALKVSDIDSQRVMLRVEQGKGHKDRYVMLSPRLQGAAAKAWLTERAAELLPVPYYHLVFTLPAAVAESPIRTRQQSTTSCSRRRPR
jgi:site-specific recombinase XerD